MNVVAYTYHSPSYSGGLGEITWAWATWWDSVLKKKSYKTVCGLDTSYPTKAPVFMQ